MATLSRDPDADLFAAQSGDSQAFTRLISDFWAEGLRMAVSYTRDDDVAADMWQDALVAAWERLPNFVGDSQQFKGWVKTILVNRCRDQLRYDRRHRPVEPSAGSAFAGTVDQPTEALHLVFDHSATPEQLVEDAAVVALLVECVAAVPEPYQTVLHLYASDHGYAEIAEIVQAPTSTVGTRLRRGRKAAQDYFLGMADRRPSAPAAGTRRSR